MSPRVANKRDVLAATHYEERAGLRPSQQPLKVVVPAVHDIERAGLGQQVIQHRRIGCFCRGNADNTGDIATQVQQRVQLDGGLSALRMRPREQRQTQLDHRRIERIDGVVQLDSERLAGVQLACATDQQRSEV